MNSSLARQEIAMSFANGHLRVAIGAVACAATIALMPLSALAHTRAANDTVLWRRLGDYPPSWQAGERDSVGQAADTENCVNYMSAAI
ncbi:MAG: hypothetical protein JO325_13510, partial [Solirubrobacterales bacterium]|nr:hypothetical protein [Solirubrobacterales bacterium]